MTINDPRAKQALYMATGGRKSSIPRGLVFWLRLILPIVLALGILWALFF